MKSDSSLSSTDSHAVVLVTGASGYIALHCIDQLLRAGYRVRGTVRSLRNTSKVQPLHNLDDSKERLKLVEADLNSEENWPSVVKDCTYILHVASPWPIVADHTTIDVAKNGTMNVLKAAANEATVKKVVITGSCSAISDGHQNDARIFNEDCWANLNSGKIEDYARSKTIAEKSAWDFWHQLPEKTRFQLTVLNPAFVIGPVLGDQSHGSATIIKRLMSYKTFLALPRISIGIVDVRDVAYAHVKALQTTETDGERILITHTPSVWFSQIANWLHKEFAGQGYKVPRLVMPKWVIKLYAKISSDSHVSAIKYRFGPELRYDNSKSKRLLKMEYTDPKKALIDMVYSMMEYGMLEEKK